MEGLVKSCELEDSTERSNAFVLPANYAVRAALNAIYDCSNIRGTPQHWLWKFADQVSAGRLDLNALALDIESGPASGSSLTCKRTDFRKNGKPSLHYTITKLLPDRFREHRPDSGWGGELEVAVVRKDEVFARKDCLEERSGVSGFAVTKHAFERYYQRERVTHEDIQSRILLDMADLDRMLAFAVASNLFAFGDAFSPDAVTALPLGDGLLIVRNAIILVEGGWRPSIRYLRKKRAFLKTLTSPDPQRSMPSMMVDGMAAEGFLTAMGVTYLSYNMLRLEQKAYASLFRAEAAKHDLDVLGNDMGRTWLPHETLPEPCKVSVDPLLPYLLNLIVNRGRSWPLWYCIGWQRSSDPKVQ